MDDANWGISSIIVAAAAVVDDASSWDLLDTVVDDDDICCIILDWTSLDKAEMVALDGVGMWLIGFLFVFDDSV